MSWNIALKYLELLDHVCARASGVTAEAPVFASHFWRGDEPCQACGRAVPFAVYAVGHTTRPGHSPAVCPRGGVYHYHAAVPGVTGWYAFGVCDGCVDVPEGYYSAARRAEAFTTDRIGAACDWCGIAIETGFVVRLSNSYLKPVCTGHVALYDAPEVTYEFVIADGQPLFTPISVTVS